MAEPAVLLNRDGAVAWLRLNRPDALNALNRDVFAALDGHLTTIERDPDIRVVVVTGNGRAFCAGADLKAISNPDGSIDIPRFPSFIREIQAVIERLAALPKPVIAAVNGITAAGGLELMMACDVVVASEDARVGDAHANYGLVPGAGGSVRLPRILGPKAAKLLLFTGVMVPAAELVASGLVNEVVPAAGLEQRVKELAGVIASKSPLSLAHMKRLVDDGLEQPIPGALRAEALALEVHMHSDDIREGLSAFREKRTPNYSGR